GADLPVQRSAGTGVAALLGVRHEQLQYARLDTVLAAREATDQHRHVDNAGGERILRPRQAVGARGWTPSRTQPSISWLSLPYRRLPRRRVHPVRRQSVDVFLDGWSLLIRSDDVRVREQR